MGATFHNTFDPKKKAAQIIQNAAKALEKELELAAGEIVQRTQSGRDADGSTFAAYSDGYELWKRKNRAGPQIPDLTLSGGMLGAVRSKVEIVGNKILGTIYVLATSSSYRRGNKVYSASNRDKARWTQTGHKARIWLQFSSSQFRRLHQSMRNLLR